MEYLGSNIRHLRKARGWTQAHLADRLEVNRSLIGAYEEGRSEPRLATLQLLAHLFGVPLGDLIEKPLDGRAPQPYQQKLRVLPVAINQAGEEEISLIPQKAAAGYTRGYADTEYLDQLQTARLPLPELQQSGTIRIFQIEGDSMLPVQPGTYIIGEYVENWQSIKSGQCYILLTLNDGIVYKRVDNEVAEKERLWLRSDNPEYEAYGLPLSEVLEVWRAKGVLSFELPDREGHFEVQNQRLLQMLDELRAQVQSLHAKVDGKPS